MKVSVTSLTAIALLPLCAVNAESSFDIVGVYHSKVKQFEAVYFMSEDESWHRDRRILEVFGEFDRLGAYDANSVEYGLQRSLAPLTGHR